MFSRILVQTLQCLRNKNRKVREFVYKIHLTNVFEYTQVFKNVVKLKNISPKNLLTDCPSTVG